MCEAFLKRLAGVLGYPVAVYDQSFLWLSEGDRLVECGQREAGIDVFLSRRRRSPFFKNVTLHFELAVFFAQPLQVSGL